MDVKQGSVPVLYLSYDGLTDPLGQSQVLPYLTGLTSFGYEISIISFEKPNRFDAERKNIETICAQHNIKWYPLRYTKTPPVLSTLKDLSKLKAKIRSLQKQTPFTMVHCRSYITALAGQWMKKKWGTKFIFDMRGFWADERVEGGLWNLSNPFYKRIYRYFKKKEKQFLEQADAVITLTYEGKKIMETWPLKKKPPITVIPCCVDLDLFDPQKINEKEIENLEEKLNIKKDDTVISYFGSIGTWYMLDEMILFFKRWLIKKPNSVFLFVTKDENEKIINAVKKHGIDEKYIRIQPAAREQMPLMIAVADLSMFFIKPVFSKKASSPTKQAEIMAMGKSVICNSGVGDTDLIVKKYHSGVLVDDFTDFFFDKAISDMQQRRFDPVEIRNGAVDFFSLETGVKKYLGVYTNVLNAKAD